MPADMNHITESVTACNIRHPESTTSARQGLCPLLCPPAPGPDYSQLTHPPAQRHSMNISSSHISTIYIQETICQWRLINGQHMQQVA